MKKKLDEFLKQQKKIIEASENPLQEAHRGLQRAGRAVLKQLGPGRGRLVEVHERLQTDLSKLAEQDFSNATMSKELNEIQTELKRPRTPC